MIPTWQVFSPFIILTIGGLAALLLEAFRSRPGQKRSAAMALFTQAVSLVLVGKMIWEGRAMGLFAHDGQPYRLFANAIQIDDFTLFLCAAILVAGLLATVAGMRYLDRHKINYGEYHAFQLLAVLGMMMLVVSVELVTLFIALELMSLPIYVMCAYRRERAEGIESGLKYFLLGGFAAAILLFGLAHIYGQAHTTNLLVIADILRTGVLPSGQPVNESMMLLGLALFAAGVLFKVAAVPLHFWLPDVYEGAPAPVTAFMAAGVKAAAFGVLVKFLATACAGPLGMAAGLPEPWIQLMVILAGLTMLVPNLIALCQRRVKRTLAYSSIAHAGYMLVAVCAMGRLDGKPGDPAVAALLYYLMVYGIMTVGAFAIVGELTGDDPERADLDAINGLAYRQPFLVAVLTLCLLSLIGVPPLAGFWGKYLVFKSAVDQGMIPLAIFAIATSVIAGYYYLRILVRLYMREPEADVPGRNPEPGLSFKLAMGAVGAAVLWLGIGWTNLLGVVPGASTLWNWAAHAAKSLEPLYRTLGQGGM